MIFFFRRVSGLIFLHMLFFSFHLRAEDQIVEITKVLEFQGHNKTQARQEMIKQATTEASEQHIISLMGEEKYLKNKSFINSSILDQSGRYILYTKPSPLEKTSDGYKMEVIIKLSLTNLKTLLLAKGLLYDLNSPPKVLPLITFSNRYKNTTFSWWSENSPPTELKIWALKTHKEIFEKLKTLGFYVFMPVQQKMYHSIPKSFQTLGLTQKDLHFLGQFFKAHIVLWGHIELSETGYEVYQLKVRLTAIQSNNGREIASLTRNFTSDRGDFDQVFPPLIQSSDEAFSESLYSQLQQVWSKGIFGSNLYRIYFKGDFNYRQSEDLKGLLNDLSLVRSYKERSSSKNELSFEVNSLSNLSSIAKSIEGSPGFKNYRLDRLEADKAYFRRR